MGQAGWSEKIRSIARVRYVEPAIKSGKHVFSIGVKEMRDILIPMGFSAANTPQVCSAIQSERFLRGGEKRLEIVGVDGPPSKQSTTVVVHYRVAGSRASGPGRFPDSQEDSETRALRVAQGIRGLLKDELSVYGGGEAFLKWMRSEDGNSA
ncbi:MAG TPA: hypothetical protein VII58_07700 [Acidobacteriaceae bacterium]